MTTFEIVPFIGAAPIRFGMNAAEVEAILGPPLKWFPDYFGNRSEDRPKLSLGCTPDGDRLMEVVFARGAHLTFDDHDLFADPGPIDILLRYDPEPYLYVGMLFFLKLGIRLSGFHDNDKPQEAIGVVALDQWNEHLADIKQVRWKPETRR